jgi:parvulin-like peptidyl-prolyl isomerase
LALLAYAFCASCPLLQAQPATDPILGRAGDLFITEREFRERFELTPGLHRQRGERLQAEKLRVFYSLAAEKLLAQEARARSLDRDSLYQEAIKGVTKLLVRDELYRREIRQRVTVSPAEVRAGMTQALTRVHVRFIFTEQEQDAAFLRSRMTSGKDLSLLVLDSSLGAFRDTATILWGDADTTIEQAAYRLASGEISPVLRAGEGFYILTVLQREPNPLMTKLSRAAIEERVATTIRMRKERVREKEYLRDLLRDKPAYSPPATFRRFAAHLDSVFRLSYQPPSTSLDRGMVERMRLLERVSLGETLIVAGSTSWTVREAIDRLTATGFTVAGDSVRGVAARLYTVFRYWSEQEWLAQEGFRLGLENSGEVQQQLGPWRDHYLAGVIRKTLYATVTISDANVYRLLAADATIPSVPEVRLRELRTPDFRAMEDAVRLLEQGVPFAEVVRQCSPDPTMRERGGLSDFFAVTERRPWGEIAMRLDSGEVYGPLRDSAGVVLVQLAGKRNAPPPGDTAFAVRFAQARAKLLLTTQQEVVNRFLAQSAHIRGLDVYTDRLERLPVTAVPMLSYRFLGFGGRMFPVPFVEEELEWLNVEPPDEIILP